MQQLSLLPSSSTNPLDTVGLSVAKSRTESSGFKNTFDEVERSFEPRKANNQAPSRSASIDRDDTVNERRDVSPSEDVPATNQHQASSAQERVEDVSGNNATGIGSKSGNTMPDDDQALPAENGNGLPDPAAENRAVSSEKAATNKPSEPGSGHALAASPGVLNGFNTIGGAENPLQQAISAASGVKGDGIGLGVLQAGLGEGVSVLGQQVSSEALAGAAARAGSLTSAQAQGDAGVKGVGAGNFGFAINGVLQADTSMSETANAKLTDLAAKAATSVDAPETSPQAGRPAADNLLTGSTSAPGQGSLAGFTGMTGAVGVGLDGLPPQAQAANTDAMDQVNEAALAAANGNARFNRAGASAAAADGQTLGDSINGMQAESESLFKAAMESVQAGRGNVSSDATELGVLKAEAASVATRAADAKAVETPGQNGVRPYVSSLGLPVDDIEWSNQLGQKLMWMNARNIQTAELHLNPADLGPIDVRIQIGAEQSSISFNSQNQSVRELLEANIHRLREMLNNPGQSENGQSGGGAFAQDSGTQSQGQSGGESLGHRSAMASASDVVDGESRSSSRSTGAESTLVDAYV